MDAYGNIPLQTSFDTGGDLPSTTPRKQVFDFVVTELEDNLSFLSDEKSELTYGRPTKWFAHTLLAKAYLNAQVYTGEAKWNEVVEHANVVINEGTMFTLQDDMLAQFRPDNGAQ